MDINENAKNPFKASNFEANRTRTNSKRIFKIFPQFKEYVQEMSNKTSKDKNQYIFNCPYPNCHKLYQTYSRYIVHIRTHVNYLYNYMVNIDRGETI